MSLVPIWLPFVMTLLAILFFTLIFFFFPILTVKAGIVAGIITGLSWFVYIAGNLVESLFSNITAMVITLTTLVTIIILIIRFKGGK